MKSSTRSLPSATLLPLVEEHFARTTGYRATFKNSDTVRFDICGTIVETPYRVIPKLTPGNLGPVVGTIGEVLVTGHVNPIQAEKLAANGVEFLDTAGNAYLNRPGIFILVSGKKPPTIKMPANQAFTPAGLRVVFALLSVPEAIDFTIRDLSRVAGVSVGAAQNACDDLERQGYLHRGSRRLLLGKNDLLHKFILHFADRLRPKLVTATYATRKPVEELAEFDFGQSAFVGGEAALWRAEKARRPDTLLLYTRSGLAEFKARGALRTTPDGPVVLLDQFWGFDRWEGRDAGLAPPILVYADLLATADSRTRELARDYYERHIAQLVEEPNA